jgi:hypothetical protein
MESQEIGSTPSETVYYEETVRNPQAALVRLVVPIATVTSTGVVAAVLLTSGIEPVLVLAVASAVLVADAAALVVFARFGPPITQETRVTDAGIHWLPKPGHELLIRFDEIESLHVEERATVRRVIVNYRDASVELQRTLTIPTANPVEFSAAVEWGLARR